MTYLKLFGCLLRSANANAFGSGRRVLAEMPIWNCWAPTGIHSLISRQTLGVQCRVCSNQAELRFGGALELDHINQHGTWTNIPRESLKLSGEQHRYKHQHVSMLNWVERCSKKCSPSPKPTFGASQATTLSDPKRVWGPEEAKKRTGIQVRNYVSVVM